MLNAEESDDILERLRHPEREAERHRPDRLFLVRNVLNALFIILAVVAMAGIAISWTTGGSTRWCYVLGLIAVFIKMIEAMLRMPRLLKRPTRTPSRHASALETALAASAAVASPKLEGMPSEQEGTPSEQQGTPQAAKDTPTKAGANPDHESAPQ